jgi:hypothetical protein
MLAPLRPLTVRISFAGVAVALAFAGCDGGSSSGSAGSAGTTGTDGGDGKYHPAPNGNHVTEKEACEALVDRQSSRLLDLSCVGTGQTCPSFLRAQFQTACMEYDRGSVDGCIAYYDQQASCEALKEAFDACVITAYPGTEPAGCPVIAGGAAGTGGTTTTGGTGGTMTGSSSSTGGSGGMTGSSSSTGGSGGMTGSSSSTGP